MTKIYTSTVHSIISGDSRDMNKVRDQSVDLVVTSPPYPMINMWDVRYPQNFEKIGICRDTPTLMASQWRKRSLAAKSTFFTMTVIKTTREECGLRRSSGQGYEVGAFSCLMISMTTWHLDTSQIRWVESQSSSSINRNS